MHFKQTSAWLTYCLPDYLILALTVREHPLLKHLDSQLFANFPRTTSLTTSLSISPKHSLSSVSNTYQFLILALPKCSIYPKMAWRTILFWSSDYASEKPSSAQRKKGGAGCLHPATHAYDPDPSLWYGYSHVACSDNIFQPWPLLC